MTSAYRLHGALVERGGSPMRRRCVSALFAGMVLLCAGASAHGATWSLPREVGAPRNTSYALVTGGPNRTLLAFAGRNHVHVVERKGGGRFGRPQTIAAARAPFILSAKSNQAGDVAVVWSAGRSRATAFALRRRGSNRFGPARAVPGGFHGLEIDGSGRVSVARTRNRRVQIARGDESGKLGAFVDTPAAGADPSLVHAVNTKGDEVIAYLAPTPGADCPIGDQTLHLARRSRAETAFGPPIAVGSGVHTSDVLLDDSGRITIAFNRVGCGSVDFCDRDPTLCEAPLGPAEVHVLAAGATTPSKVLDRLPSLFSLAGDAAGNAAVLASDGNRARMYARSAGGEFRAGPPFAGVSTGLAISPTGRSVGITISSAGAITAQQLSPLAPAARIPHVSASTAYDPAVAVDGRGRQTVAYADRKTRTLLVSTR
jgi:hypothetical protein